MRDRVTVETDNGDILRYMPAAREEIGDSLDMKLGEFGFHGLNERLEARLVHRHGALARFGQANAKALPIGHGVEGDGIAEALSVGFDERGVDAVTRSARHEADRQHGLAVCHRFDPFALLHSV